MPSTTNTLTKSKSKQTKSHGGHTLKLARSKYVAAAAAKASTMAPIAPSMIPNTSMMTVTMTMPVMMPPPSTEFDMKMLEELYASVCGQDQCSLFILGEKRDRVIDIVRNVVTIRSSCEPNKLAMLTPKRWVNFILHYQQIDSETKQLNLKTRPVAFRLHLGDGWYVTGGYNCMEFRRFYVPYGASHEHVRPARDGIGLRLDEWAELLVLIPTIHKCHPELSEICTEAESQLHG